MIKSILTGQSHFVEANLSYPRKTLNNIRHVIFVVLLCAVAPTVKAQVDARDMITNSVITDPSLSRRCEALLAELDKKRAHKQKLTELLVRNERMQRVTPAAKKQLKRNLELNHRKIDRELDLARMKIQRQEETLIRGGCPGVVLE